LDSPFDWEWVVIEQSMRGTLKLTGERQGRQLTWTVPLGILEDAEVRPNLPIELLTPYESGRDLFRQKRAAEAVDCWRWLAEHLQRPGGWRQSTWLYFRMASALIDFGIWDEAEAFLQEALAEAQDVRAKVSILDRMGESYLRQGRFAEAEEMNLAELRLKVATWGESLEIAQTEFQLGWVAHNQGVPMLTAEYFKQGFAIQQKLAPKSRVLAKSLFYLGRVAEEQGELETAEIYLHDSWQIFHNLAPDNLYTLASTNNLAGLYNLRGEWDLGEDLLRQALPLAMEVGKGTRVLATILSNLGDLSMIRGEAADAEDFYQRALGIFKNLMPDSENSAVLFRSLGELDVERGELKAAREHFQSGIAIMDRLMPFSKERALLLAELGNVNAKSGDLESAGRLLKESLAISQKLAPQSLLTGEILRLSASVLRRENRIVQAEEKLTSALEILEMQISHLGGSTERKGAFRADAGGIYRDAISIEIELGHQEKAFQLLERFRGQAFLSLLAERDLTFSSDIPPALDRERRRLHTLYDGNELRLATLDPDRDHAAIEALRSEQLHLRQEREETDAQIRRASPRLAAMIQPHSLNFEEVRAALDPGTVMLSYSVGEEETQLFIVTPGKDLAVKTLPLGEEALRKEVTHLRQRVEQVQSRTGLGAEGLDWASRHLYQELVGPAEPWIAAGGRILIVPDGPLHVLPFAALIRPSTPKGKGGRSWQYLVEWKPLHTALSGTVYAELQAHRRKSSDLPNSLQWVAFGDPWFPPHLAESRPQEPQEARLRSFSTRTGLHWQRLPESRREVSRIAELYPPAARRVYLDREATEERAKALGPETKIIHFATHAYVDDRSPLDSGLVLAIPEQFTEGHDNGLLQVWEIFESMRLDADLVVLSACETGLGEIRGGEGIIGLTRAFQFAGARSVLASLWRVDDKATAELMERFYHHLHVGEPKAEALRAAQLDLLRGKESAAAPYFWASMQLFGDWQ
jgi:CHAT domain-containing protein